MIMSDVLRFEARGESGEKRQLAGEQDEALEAKRSA
jgi:hypothetical protein